MVFASDRAAEYWFETVKETVKLHEVSVLAWCLMSNHYHLVLRSGPDPIWRPMARIQRRISMHHNQELGVKGRLWQSRYRAKLILEEGYFEQVIAYVHLNPVAAGLTSDPADYQWSGHRELVGHPNRGLIDVRETLRRFGNGYPSSQSMYLRRVRQIQEEKWLRKGVRTLPWWKPVADNEQTIEEADAPGNSIWFDGNRVALREADIMPLNDLQQWFENVVPSSCGSLTARTQTSTDLYMRCLFALIAIVEIGHQNKKVARALNRSPSSVSRWLTTGLEQKANNPRFREQLDHLIQRLRSDLLQQ
jgi:REP element-mobilizing transposase RayT